MLQLFRGVNGQFRGIRFAARWTHNPAKLPFRETGRTDQRALAAFSKRAQYSQAGLPLTKWTNIRRRPAPSQVRSCSNADRVRLEICPGKKVIRLRSWGASVALPKRREQMKMRLLIMGGEFLCRCAELGGAASFAMG